MTDKVVVLSTCGTEQEAEQVARVLVERKLAACVNVVAPVQSFYWWQGKVEKSSEHLLIIKTSRDLFDKVRSALESIHSYELPELVALPIVDGSANYLNWMNENLAGPQG